MASEISEACQKQSDVISLVKAANRELDDAIHQNAALIEQVTVTSLPLTKQPA